VNTQPPSTVSVFAPATVANVGSAFDVLGFALEAPGDTVTARRTDSGDITVTRITGDDGRLPLEAEKNTAGVSIEALRRHLISRDPGRYQSVGFELELRKGLPIGSGLGSSSASTVAAVVAANEILGSPLTRVELLPFAMEGERIACGAAHADNVAPCLLGGFALIRSYDPLDVISLPSPASVWVAVVSPHLELKTFDARRVLRRSVSLEAAVAQWGNVAALVAGIYQNDVALMGRSLEDRIIEPERAELVPGYLAAKAAALQAGAAGCSLSGSGPSLFALCASEELAGAVAATIVTSFGALGIGATSYTSRVNTTGAVVTHRS
jgi:homoserine kinase